MRASPARRIAAGAVRLDAAAGRLTRAQTQLLRARGEALAGAAARLHALSPLATLARGYAIVSRPPDLPVVQSAAQLAVGERVRLAAGNRRGGCARRSHRCKWGRGLMQTAQIDVGRARRAGARRPGGMRLIALILLATPWLAMALPRPDPVPGGVAVLTLPAGFDAAAAGELRRQAGADRAGR